MSIQQPVQPEGGTPGAVRATQAPPMSSTNRLQNKRRRLAAWAEDPSKIEKDLDDHRKALAKALKDDQEV